MADQYLGEIRMFAGNFAPKNWALCNGQLLPITQNTGLFSLLGTRYGGDGKSTFALPDLRDSAPMHFGQGPGLTSRQQGEVIGAPFVTLLQTEIPAHTHTVQASTGIGVQGAPGNANTWGSAGRGRPAVYSNAAPNVLMNPLAIGVAGGSLPHNNMQPVLVVTFIIALVGIFPPRS